jgi:hypothetical protein
MSLKELLTLIVVIPLFLFLASLFPQTHAVFVGLWVVCLGFDVYSTYVFYLEDPNQFQNNERNKLFTKLTKKFGFKKTTILFPIAIEIPLLLFFAFLPLQILQLHMFTNAPNLVACLATSFGISAVGHLQAAIKNTLHTHKQQKQKQQNSV